MSRDEIIYAERREAGRAFDGVDAAQPTPGFYRFRLKRGAPPVGIRIYFGLPLEPWTGEVMDRAPCWNARMNAAWIDIDRVWPAAMKEPIDEAEYRFLAQAANYAVRNDAYDPRAQPHKAVDWSTASVPTF